MAAIHQPRNPFEFGSAHALTQRISIAISMFPLNETTERNNFWEDTNIPRTFSGLVRVHEKNCTFKETPTLTHEGF